MHTQPQAAALTDLIQKAIPRPTVFRLLRAYRTAIKPAFIFAASSNGPLAEGP